MNWQLKVYYSIFCFFFFVQKWCASWRPSKLNTNDTRFSLLHIPECDEIFFLNSGNSVVFSLSYIWSLTDSFFQVLYPSVTSTAVCVCSLTWTIVTPSAWTRHCLSPCFVRKLWNELNTSKLNHHQLNLKNKNTHSCSYAEWCYTVYIKSYFIILKCRLALFCFMIFLKKEKNKMWPIDLKMFPVNGPV